MPLSIHQSSVPVFVHGLRQLAHFLDRAREHAAERGIDPGVLVDARLADDMLPLSGQIQRASDTSKLSAERLSGIRSPSMPDTERGLDELESRIEATIAYLESIEPTSMDGDAIAEVVLDAGQWRVAFSREDYLTQFALPNFQFHVETAYAILRHAGVPLGKRDFLGRIGRPVGV